MTVSISRLGWLQLYTQTRGPSGFLQLQFSLKPGGVYKGAKIALDVERYGEDVAIAITKCTGPNLNDLDVFTTKEFEPPAYGEAFPLDVCELLDRMAGVDPYSAEGLDYSRQMANKMAQGFALIGNKITRAVELQASQILQTGILTLLDDEGATVYTLDFKPKSTHFPTAAIDWPDTNYDPIADLRALANVIRADGQVNPNRLIFGEVALTNFIANTNVQTLLDNRRMELGTINPRFATSGATFYGNVWIGSYMFEMWTYPATYKHPQTGVVTKYVTDDKVIMTSSTTRLDITSAVVPLPLGPDPRVAGLLPGRLTSIDNDFDVTPNIYATPNGKQIMGELESRPLLIPVQIDGYGCLNTIT